MLGTNNISVTGAMTEPQFEYTSNQQLRARFSIPTHSRHKDERTGQRKTTWIRVTLFGRQAENLQQYGKGKGQALTVTGQIEERHWSTRENEPRFDIQMVADNMFFVGGQDDDSSSANGHGGPVREPAPVREPVPAAAAQAPAQADEFPDIPF